MDKIVETTRAIAKADGLANCEAIPVAIANAIALLREHFGILRAKAAELIPRVLGSAHDHHCIEDGITREGLVCIPDSFAGFRPIATEQAHDLITHTIGVLSATRQCNDRGLFPCTPVATAT